jgi:hypothetical protein
MSGKVFISCGQASAKETTAANGDIIDNHFGMAGGTAYISPTAFQVEFNDCGTWVFLSPP